MCQNAGGRRAAGKRPWFRPSAAIIEIKKALDQMPTSSISLPDRATATSSLRHRVGCYVAVIYALIMHDIKNRFFGSGLGQIVMVLWPFVHIVVMLVIYTVSNRPNPYGSSLLQYASVSMFPFICLSYVMRWIVYSALTNRSFLQYPIIRPLDIIFARALLEIVSISLVGIILIIALLAMGIDVMPANRDQAVYAVCGTLFVAIGIGVPNAVMAFILPLWNIVISLVIILMWVSSGVLFVASQLPDQIRVPLSYNPVLQCVEWFRVAWYSSYPQSVLDRTYVIEFGLTSLTIGLIMERLLRRYF